MATDDVTVYVKIPRALAGQIDQWTEEMNSSVAALGARGVMVQRPQALRILIERGVEAMREDHARAARELEASARPAPRRKGQTR